MRAPRLWVVSGFVGSNLEPLTLLSATTTEQVDGDDSAQFRIRTPTRTDITLRTPLRFIGSDGITREYRVRRFVRDPLTNVATIDGAPVFADLTKAGLIRQVVNGTEYTSFAGSFTPAQWITNFVLTNLSADGLSSWLDTTLGTIESTQLVSLSWTQWTRAELLRTLADALGMDLVLAPVTPGGLYRIHLLTERGSDVDPIRISQRGALQQLNIDSSDDGLATMVRPQGEVPDGGTEPATIANHAFAVTGIASGWVTIADPSNTAKPIAFDDMANTWYLQFVTGTSVVRRAISDSRASDGAVYLADTSGLSVGASITFVADANGTPLTVLTYPAAIAEFGAILVPLSIAGMRGEANVVANPNFNLGAAQWESAAGGWLEPYDPTETSDLVGAMNGSKTAGAPATLSVDGLSAGAIVRRGERVEVASVQLGTSNATKTVPSNGNVTLPLSGTLAQSVTSGQALRVYSSDGVLYVPGAITANGATSSGASSVPVTALGLANRQLMNGDKIRFTLGGTYGGVISIGNTNTNGTGSPVVWTQAFALSQQLVNPNARPDSPTLSDGHVVTLVNYGTGQSIAAEVDGGYTANATTITLRITVPAGTTYTIGPGWQLFATQTSTETRTVTNSNTEWPDNGQIAVTWGSAVGFTDATSIAWLNADDALLGSLAFVAYTSSTNWTLSNPSLRRITTGSVLYSEPETLYCGATSVANGSGAMSLVLQTANAASLSDNAVVRIVRNTAGWLDQGAASPTLMRASQGWQSAPFVIVASGTPRTVWAHFAAHFWHSRNDYPTGLTVGLQLDLVHADTNAVLGTVTSDPLPIETTSGVDRPQPTACVVKVQVEIATTTRAFLRARPVTMSHAVDYATKGYALASYAMLTLGADPNVPFTPSAHPHVGWHTAVRYLQEYGREVRSITCTAAQLADIPGAQFVERRVACGVRVHFATSRFTDTQRITSFTRNHFHPEQSSMIMETLRRTASRILGTGSVTSGSGGVTGVSGGSVGGGSSAGLTLSDDSGASIPGVTALTISGLGVALAANGPGSARVSIPSTVDPTGVDAVISGGGWVTRDLVAQPGYDITVAAGSGVIGGRLVSWQQTTVVTGAANALIYVDATGTVRQRAAGSPETLSAVPELLLYRTYVDVLTYGSRVYAVAESRTYYRVVPRVPLAITGRVQDAVVASGTWAGAVAVNAIGDINWYFANLALYPLVEELPSVVEAHLDVQIAQLYGSGGTGSTDWTSLHGTSHAGYLRWPYDVGDPRGTPTKKRADSHDAYAATFLRLAARFARVASGGLAWWDANIGAIQDAAYYNIIVPIRLVNGGAGYLTETFQDSAVYPFNQTLDNVECYRGLKDALDLMTDRGGSQATWAATYSGTPGNILAGIQSQWSSSANASGETGWLSVAYDIAGAAKLTNPMTRFYPDLTIGVPVAIYDVPLSGTDSIARERLDQLFRWLNQKAPTWFMSRKYDLYPWGMVAASAAKVGYRDLAERWLTFVQCHHAYDSPGYLLVHDLGWARYVERVLAGDVLA